MSYGTLKIDTITFTDDGIDKSVSVSGLVQNPTFSKSITVTGTISGSTLQGQTVSGVTITGTLIQTTTLNSQSGVFGGTVLATGTISGSTLQGQTVSGVTITGTLIQTTTLNSQSGVFGGTVLATGVTVDVSGTYVGNVATVSALNIDCTSGNYFVKTITGNSTFTVSNVPVSGRSYGMTLEVTHTAGTITWFSGVEWPASTAPTLTTGKTHLFIFVTDDGGARWRGASLVDYVN